MAPSFIKSAPGPAQWPTDAVPEVCLLGRSNVGKSSLINALANAKLAITSKTPGRTRLANFYDFGRFRLVDLPGVGYSRLSKEKQDTIADLITQFVAERTNLRLAAIIVDSRTITPVDAELADAVKARFGACLVIANKADALKSNDRRTVREKIAKEMRVAPSNVLVVSAKLREGIKEVMNQLLAACQ